jgi:hypothetical protein
MGTNRLLGPVLPCEGGIISDQRKETMQKLKHTPRSGSSLYELDFYGWALTNAKLLRAGKFSEADMANIAEELERMRGSEKRELMNRLTVLLAHLLKWRFQAKRRSRSWAATIVEQRLQSLG